MANTSKGKVLYKSEFQLLQRVREIAEDESLSKDQILKEYLNLSREYEKLLRWAVKITRIGDVNQRKLESQRELLEERSIKLKELSEIKSHFFANISHEFRTPLTLIINPLEQMLIETTDPVKKKNLNLVLRNAQRLICLINQLLELSKLESGTMRLKAYNQNIIPFLKGIVSSFELLAQQNDVDLSFSTEKDDFSLYFEPEKIEEVICNLLLNGLKFTPPGGQVKVSVREFPQGKVEISVSDTGPGIPGEQITAIFQRFHQMEGMFEHHKKGFGIGLALVKEYVHLHKGEIRINSTHGKGTELIIVLPMGMAHLKPEEIINNRFPLAVDSFSPKIADQYVAMLELEREMPKLDSNHDDQREIGSSKRDIVLVVEDNQDMRRYIKDALDTHYRVVEAGNGKEGMAIARDIIPDIIISDIIMPEVNGCDLCRELKADIKTSHIPIVLLTAKASDDDIIEGLETGADDYITKPFSVKIMAGRIKNLIDQRRQLQQNIQQQLMSQPGEMSISSLDQKFIRELEETIEINLSDPKFGLDEMANALFMSRATLYRKVYALTGEAPKQYIQSYRLNRAMQLLKTNFGNITEVAYKVGFSSSAYFTKCFKDKFLQLPSAFQTSETH